VVHPYESVEFPSEGAVLRGRLYRAVEASRPAVVMTHGTSATITMAIDAYAEAIFAAGYTVLLYDHHSLGRSGGEPRQRINPWVQARGYRDAVAFLRDAHGTGKIALWGDSYSAMVVLVVGALLDDIAAVVAQIPVCGVRAPDVAPGDAPFAKLREIFEHGDVEHGPSQVAGPLPVVSSDPSGTPSLLAPIQAFRWFVEFGGRFGSRWENSITRIVPETDVPFHPIVTADRLSMPVLFMVGRDDEMIHCDPGAQRAVYERIPDPKEFVEIDGGHFGLIWHPGPLFDQASRRQVDFLRRVLG